MVADYPHGRVHDKGVVDGLLQVVVPSRLAKLGLDVQIDLEGLRSVLLALERAVTPERSKPA